MAEEAQGDETQSTDKAAEPQKKQGVLEWAAGFIARRAKEGWEAGHVQAFARQGVNELGTVFGKAWPDSVQVDEPGAIFNPLYRDMPSPTGPNLYGHRPDPPTPSEIANDNTVHGPDNSASLHKGKSL